MKKLYFFLIIIFMSSSAFAEQGQIKQNGFFAGTSKVLGDDKGNFTIISVSYTHLTLPTKRIV